MVIFHEDILDLSLTRNLDIDWVCLYESNRCRKFLQDIIPFWDPLDIDGEISRCPLCPDFFHRTGPAVGRFKHQRLIWCLFQTVSIRLSNICNEFGWIQGNFRTCNLAVSIISNSLFTLPCHCRFSTPILFWHIPDCNFPNGSTVYFFYVVLCRIICYLHRLQRCVLSNGNSCGKALYISLTRWHRQLFHDIRSSWDTFKEVGLTLRFFFPEWVIWILVWSHPGILQDIAFSHPVIQLVLGLCFLVRTAIIKHIMLIQYIGCIIVLFQLVGIFVTNKITISVIQFCSFIIRLITSLIVKHQAMLIIYRIHIF